MARDEAVPATDGALQTLLRDARLGPPEPDDATPWDFVLRWPQPVLSQRAWPIISRMLTDDDALLRERAVEFVANWRDGAELTSARLLEVAERHSDLFGSQTPAGVPLREKLARALANRAARADGARIAAVLRRLAANEPLSGGAATILGRFEPAFVTAQAQRWGDDALAWTDEAARSLALFRRDAVLPFLQGVRGLDEASRRQLLETVESSIKRDDAAAAAVAQSQGLAAPSRQAPSPEQCRLAIGLA